jgi:hypothetical protein
VRYLKIAGHVVGGLVYLVIVIGAFSAATSKFETLVLAGIVQVYAAALYNFSLLGEVADVNNYAAFVRFRVLASAQGITENEDGTFVDQEEALVEALKSCRTKVRIGRISNAVAALYALFMIVVTVFR